MSIKKRDNYSIFVDLSCSILIFLFFCNSSVLASSAPFVETRAPLWGTVVELDLGNLEFTESMTSYEEGFYYTAGTVWNDQKNQMQVTVFKWDIYGSMDYIVIDVGGGSVAVTGIDSMREMILVTGTFEALSGELNGFAINIAPDFSRVNWALGYQPQDPYRSSCFLSMETFLDEGEEKAAIGGALFSKNWEADYWILTIDQEGKLDWSYSFWQQGVDYGEEVDAVAWNPYKNTISFAGGYFDDAGYRRVIVGDMCPCGVFAEVLFSGSYWNDYASRIVVEEEDLYIIVGDSEYGGPSNYRQIMYMRYTRYGIPYIRLYSSREDNFGEDFVVLDDEYSAIVGNSYHDGEWIATILRLGNHGHLDEVYRYSGSPTENDFLYTISNSLIEETHFFASGKTNSYDLGGIWHPGWALQLDKDGGGPPVDCIYDEYSLNEEEILLDPFIPVFVKSLVVFDPYEIDDQPLEASVYKGPVCP